MFIFKIGSDEVRVRTDAEFQCLNDDEKISYVWNDLWPDDLGMTWLEKVLYDHDTGDLGLPEIWDEYVSEFYPEKYREIENEEPEDRHKKSGLIFEFIDELEDKEFSRALLFLVNQVYDESLFYDWLIDSVEGQDGLTQTHIDANKENEEFTQSQIPVSEKLRRAIKTLYLNKKINEATFQCFTIIAEGLKNNQIQEKKEEFLDDISSVESFESQIRSGLNPLKEEVGSDVNKIFKIEQSKKYSDFNEFLNDLDYEIMQKVFNEMIKEQFDDADEDDDDDENLESFMESLENDLESITKKEEGKESDQDLKPTSDKAFSDSINEFLMANAAAIISANYWTLAEIKSHVDPETWEEDPDHLESVISNYKLFSNKDDLLEWINERIDLYEDMGSLDKFLSIGEAEECDYPDAESFLEALDCDYIIGVLDICWAKACTIS